MYATYFIRLKSLLVSYYNMNVKTHRSWKRKQ